MSISERQKEIRRRRKRREKYSLMKAKLPKADGSAREKMIRKLRQMTPGAEAIIAAWGLKKS